MAILSNSTLKIAGEELYSSGKLTPVISMDTESAPTREADKLLHLNNRLASTLDIHELIEIFAGEVKAHLNYDSIKFVNEGHGKAIKIGRDFSHQIRYMLVLHQQVLGEMVITRRRAFTPAETTRVESLLRHLLYPLRNALLYRTALLEAHKDPLTGVKNRAALDEALRSELGRARRYHSQLSLIIFDIDHFKRVNDTWGHTTGDCLLKQLATTAASCIRRSDMLFRYGGEEFVVLLHNTDTIGAARLAERIRRKVEKLENPCETGISITVSAGVASMVNSDTELSLFERADQAMYQAKAAGRNQIIVADR